MLWVYDNNITINRESNGSRSLETKNPTEKTDKVEEEISTKMYSTI